MVPLDATRRRDIEQAPADQDRFRVLIIEDDFQVGRTLKRILEGIGRVSATILTQPDEAENEAATFNPRLVFVDLKMPGRDGFDVISGLKSLDPGLTIVVLSAYSTLDNAVQAIKLGAFDFLPKPFDPESVESMLRKVQRELMRRTEVIQAEGVLDDPTLQALIGESQPMERLRQLIQKVRTTPETNVLIEGESGTGKELVARAIHGENGPFVPVNMGAIPDNLAESELFGHRQGAFSGAHHDREGLIRMAHGGTLFLDEINATSPALQVKLLRFLEHRTIRPLGHDVETAVGCRVIAATNRNLDTLADRGEFRHDLLYRLSVLRVRVPPLRERKEDIVALAQSFLDRFSGRHRKLAGHFSESALLMLREALWPGNVRELENTVEQAVILAPADAREITADMLWAGRSPAALQANSAPATHSPPENAPCSLAELEAEHIRSVLRRCEGNKSAAARILQIHYKTLLRKLARLGIR